MKNNKADLQCIVAKRQKNAREVPEERDEKSDRPEDAKSRAAQSTWNLACLAENSFGTVF